MTDEEQAALIEILRDHPELQNEFGVEIKPALSVYPNPSYSEVYFKFELPEEAGVAFSVYDVHGRVVAREEAYFDRPGANLVKLDVSRLSGGTYHYRGTMAGAPFSGTFVVSRH